MVMTNLDLFHIVGVVIIVGRVAHSGAVRHDAVAVTGTVGATDAGRKFRRRQLAQLQGEIVGRIATAFEACWENERNMKGKTFSREKFMRPVLKLRDLPACCVICDEALIGDEYESEDEPDAEVKRG